MSCHCMLQLFSPGKTCSICEGYYEALRADNLLKGIEDMPVITCAAYACPICGPEQGRWMKSRQASKKPEKTDSLYRFVTFTQCNKEDHNYDRLVKVLAYLKRSKHIEQLEYTFEEQKNGNPHLHCHWYSPKYYNAVQKQLKKINVDFIDSQPRKGSFQQCIDYMSKLESKSDLLKNKISAYSIELQSEKVKQHYDYGYQKSHEKEAIQEAI